MPRQPDRLYQLIVSSYPSVDGDDMLSLFQFTNIMSFDNAEAITLKPRPNIDCSTGERLDINMSRFMHYCDDRQIGYFLCREFAAQIHYHGLMHFPNKKTYTRFQKWFNKEYGFLHRSTKQDDLAGWYHYCTKAIKDLPKLEEFVDEVLDIDSEYEDNYIEEEDVLETLQMGEELLL